MKRWNLTRQIFVRFLFVIVFCLVSVGVFSYWQSARLLDQQLGKFVRQIIVTASDQTYIYLKTYERVSNSIVSNAGVQRFLELDPADSYENYAASIEIKHDSLQPLFIVYDQLNLISILNEHGRAVTFDPQYRKDFNEEELKERYRRLEALTPDNGQVAILNLSMYAEDQNKVITLARKIHGKTNYEFKGVLAIEFSVKELARIWSSVDLENSGYFFIADKSGMIIYHPDAERIGAFLDSSIQDRIVRLEGHEFVADIDGEKQLVVTQKSDYSGWYLAVSLSIKELRSSIASIRFTTLIVGLLTLLIAAWLAYRFGQSLSAPITKLKESMRETEKGNWQYIPDSTRRDEIGELTQRYNLMVSRLSQMIERVYDAELKHQKTELERQKAESQALELQINPHFLYNTLATINGYAIVQRPEHISDIVEALSYMLRYSLKTNLEEITVANELNHVRNYMIILQHRIQRDFELDVVIPPGLLLEKLVRLSLQPLVENAYQHAFPDGIGPDHFIRIDAATDNGLFMLSVEDNGVGISLDKLEEIHHLLQANELKSSSTSPAERRGIGLMNVHRRIQIVYGEQYGLQVRSNAQGGTSVTMMMPHKR
jgi:two-component system sensor histidine kinase YesM